MHFFSSLFKKTNTPVKKRKEKKVQKIYTTEEIATHFNISKKTIEEILLELTWIKEDRLPTELGIQYGALLKDDNILLWKESILENEKFITKINSKINTLIFALSQNFTKHKNTSSDYAYIA